METGKKHFLTGFWVFAPIVLLEDFGFFAGVSQFSMFVLFGLKSLSVGWLAQGAIRVFHAWVQKRVGDELERARRRAASQRIEDMDIF